MASEIIFSKLFLHDSFKFVVYQVGSAKKWSKYEL